MKLRFEIIAHRNQRYKTSGDYYQHKGVWWFKVSRMKDKRHIYLLLFHEFIEWGLCRLWGIKQRQIDKFDMAYEKAREASSHWKENHTSRKGSAHCGCPLRDEPGDDIHAPYHDAHAIATQCEWLIAKALGVDWIDYEDAVESL